MADITKCKGTNCDLAPTCYRYTAPKGYIQSYFSEVPLNKETNTCDEYWKDSKYVTVNIESATGEDLGKVTYIPLLDVDITKKMTPENHIDVLSEIIKQDILNNKEEK